MSAMPKPPRRLPKPRRPLKRSTKLVARTKRPNVRRLTAAALETRRMDAVWAYAVREKGPCAALGSWTFRLPDQEPTWYTHTRCSGPIDPAHGISRRFRATRHLVENGFPLCREAHHWFTAHPLQWIEWLIQYLGRERYEALRSKAQGGKTK